MPASHHDWSGGLLPTIERHSMAKHNILAEYIRRYINVLMQNPRIPKLDITLIDGFAGGGAYITETGQPWDGSSLVLLKAVENAIIDINKDRREARIVNADFVFIEKKRANFQSLCRILAERGYCATNSRIKLIHDSFESRLDGLIESIKQKYGKSHRAIFVLDQYGYADVYAESIKRIFSELPNSEIFLTLAVEYIFRYRKELNSIADELCRGMRIADPHMNLLLSDVSEQGIINSQGPQKHGIMRALQRLLHDIFTRQVNARYYTPFFITSSKTWSSYWFLHLANSYRANDVVKELHWSQHNHFRHYGEAGFNMLGYDPKKDTSQIAFDFDSSAEARTRLALMDEIPQLLYSYAEKKISVRDLYIARCNETPADLRIFQAAIDQLCVDGQLEKTGRDGERRRVGTAVRADDRILIPKQLCIFDMSGQHRQG